MSPRAIAIAIACCAIACAGTADASRPSEKAALSGQPSAAATTPTAATATTPQPGDQRALEALMAFARAPSAMSFAAVPFAQRVALGLADRIDVTRDRDALRRTDAWILIPASPWRGRSIGAVTALDLLAKSDPTAITIGAHPHCASPPVAAPLGFASHRRVSIQPAQIDTCVLWWTVDLFVSGAGQIDAVTLDVWEP